MTSEKSGAINKKNRNKLMIKLKGPTPPKIKQYKINVKMISL